MYPNLYPHWPMLLHGRLHGRLGAEEGGVPLCVVSQDGGVVLWGGRKGQGLDVRIMKRCKGDGCGQGLFEVLQKSEIMHLRKQD